MQKHLSGSANIRIGLATHDIPFNIPHCIARYTSQVLKKNVQDQVLSLTFSKFCNLWFSSCWFLDLVWAFFRCSILRLLLLSTWSVRRHMILWVSVHAHCYQLYLHSLGNIVLYLDCNFVCLIFLCFWKDRVVLEDTFFGWRGCQQFFPSQGMRNDWYKWFLDEIRCSYGDLINMTCFLYCLWVL